MTTESRSGLSVTGPMGDPFRVVPDHRAGFMDQDEVEGITERSWTWLEKQANTHTVGHLERYRTHLLKKSADAAHPGAECVPVQNRFVGNSNNFPLWSMFASTENSADHSDIYGRPLWEFIARIAADTESKTPICDAPVQPRGTSL